MAFTRGAALDYLGRRFNGLLDWRRILTSYGTSPALVAPFNAERVQLTFCNLGDTSGLILPSSQVLTTEGIHIGAAGGILTFNLDEDGVLPIQEWWAVSSAAAQSMLVIEVFRDTAYPSESP